MKSAYHIAIAIASLLIIATLIFPPWKNSFTGQFAGFHYLFSEPDLVNMMELDYARLGIINSAIILILVTVYTLLQVPQVNDFFHTLINVQNIKRLIINFAKIIIFLLFYFLIMLGLGKLLN